MKRFSPLCFLVFLLLSACVEKTELPISDSLVDFQPLAIGNFWIYQTEEINYFGENDSEESSYLTRDLVRSTYINESGELVYLLERGKSDDGVSWSKLVEYTMILRNNTLLKTLNNQTEVTLVFPFELGTDWNGKIYQANGDDSFTIDQIEGELVRVNQEELDDEVTIRDLRYEVFQRSVGLIESYKETVTYCSRNDCLGQKIIDGGSKYHFSLVEYGEN